MDHPGTQVTAQCTELRTERLAAFLDEPDLSDTVSGMLQK
jgi:hypothetical protein